MSSTVPALWVLSPNKPEISLVNQRRRLQCLPRLLLVEPLPRQLAQFLVNQRQKLLRGVRIALLDGGQDAGNVGHEAEGNRPKDDRQEGSGLKRP